MTVATLEIAQSLGLSEPELLRRALVSFLQEQRRDLLQVRLEILARYRATSIAMLEEMIRSGEVVEHPGWEDLIVAENVSARLEEIDGYLRRL